jgi:anthranilate synthase/aminodeoxychorismate synthase-like glutamine amidotransferase
MKILLVDNYDSFTYNLVELLRKIQDTETTVLQSDKIDIQEAGFYDKIIFSPGPGLPDESPVMARILETYDNQKDILGICLGHQAICTFYGGKLINLPEVIHGQSKEINIVNKTPLFDGLPGKINAGLYHSWICDTQSLPTKLVPLAFSTEGFLMAVKHRLKRVFGLQFHPESFITEFGESIMSNFVNF